MASATNLVRDAGRSRRAILDAAEELFARQGFEATSLGQIGALAGVSRATPSYFFGSKEQLYAAVLERLFADRDAATEAAFGGLLQWARDERPGALAPALRSAVEGYVAFLQRRPAFPRLLQREELSGGTRLSAVPRRSRAMTDAFEAVRRAGRKRKLRAFSPDDAVLVLVSLTFSPLTQGSTFMASLGRDLADPRTRRRHVALVTDQLHALITGRSVAG